MSGQHVIDATDQTFNTAVVEASKTQLVIIDFWAPWCGPCRTLSPLLEDLAEEYGGAFLLAKVDVDQNPGIAQAVRIQSIPTLLAIHEGAPLDQQVGALGRVELTAWIDGLLEAAGIEAKGAEAPAVPTDAVAAEAHWRGVLAEKPENPTAQLGLGRLLFARGEAEEARALLLKIDPAAAEYSDALATLALSDLLEEIASAGGPDAIAAALAKTPDDAELQYLSACVSATKLAHLDALRVLVGLVGSERGDQKERAKKAAGKVFAAAGRGDDAIERLRRDLARLLY